MPNYKEMYFKLFRAHAKVISILEEVEKETEEMYKNSEGPLEFVDFKKRKQEKE